MLEKAGRTSLRLAFSMAALHRSVFLKMAPSKSAWYILTPFRFDPEKFACRI